MGAEDRGQSSLGSGCQPLFLHLHALLLCWPLPAILKSHKEMLSSIPFSCPIHPSLLSLCHQFLDLPPISPLPSTLRSGFCPPTLVKLISLKPPMISPLTSPGHYFSNLIFLTAKPSQILNNVSVLKISSLGFRTTFPFLSMRPITTSAADSIELRNAVAYMCE